MHGFFWTISSMILLSLIRRCLSRLGSSKVSPATVAAPVPFNQHVLDCLEAQSNVEKPKQSSPTLPELVRATELFRYLENDAFEKTLENISILNLKEGQYLPPLEESALVVVLEGMMKVLLFDISYDGDDTSGFKPNLLKLIHAGGSLTPMASVLSCLTGALDDGIGNSVERLRKSSASGKVVIKSPSPHEKKIRLQAGGDVKIALVPVTMLVRPPLIQPRNALYLAQAVIRRLYLVTFPICRHYFGLQKEVLRCEQALTQISSRDMSQTFPSQPMLSWLQRARLSQTDSVSPDSPKGIVLSEACKSPVALRATLNTSENEGAGICISECGLTTSPKSIERLISPRLEGRPGSVDLRIQVPGISRSPSPNFSKFHSPSVLSRTESDLFQSRGHSSTTSDYSNSPISTSVLRDLRRSLAKRMCSALGLTSAKVTDTMSPVAPHTMDYNTLPGLSTSNNSMYLPLTALEDELEIILFPRGSILAHEGERYPGFYYVISGNLEARSSSNVNIEERDDDETASFILAAGAIVGYSCLLGNNRSMFDIEALTDSYVGFIPRKNMSQLINQNPEILLIFGRRLLEHIPEIIKLVDLSLEWMEVGGGQTVYERGDLSDALYIVMRGRLRTFEINPSSGTETAREFGRGKSVGALELYTTRRRPSKLFAVRKSELVRIQLCSYKTLSVTHPQLAFRLSKIIAANAPSLIENSVFVTGAGTNVVNSEISTIAVLPLSTDVPGERFASILVDSIATIGIRVPSEMMILDSATVSESLGEPILPNRGSLELENYLSHLQDNVSFTVFVADLSENSTWTRTCIAHADMILMVGMNDGDFTLSAIEKKVIELRNAAQKKLVLLHDVIPIQPMDTTIHWLSERNGYDGFHQLWLPKTRPGPNTIASQTPLLAEAACFHRLARELFGKSIALVLGGGGARGISHLGVIKAFEEEGIPIDIVGGTSIGAFVGAIYARELSFDATFREVKKFSEGMRNWRFFLDLTFPRLSVTTGSQFNRAVQKAFGQQQFSDLWLDFYCSVTNLTKHCVAQTIRQGTLWQNVRGSMSVAGFVPPICSNGDMILDGCYSANVPIAPARARGAQTIFAVDVSNMNDYIPQNYGTSLSGWRLLYDYHSPAKHIDAVCRWINRSKGDNEEGAKRGNSTSHPPSYSELIERLSFATSLHEIDRLKTTPGCYYFRQPVESYNPTDFDKFDKIFNIGYKAAKRWVAELRKDGIFEELAIAKA